MAEGKVRQGPLWAAYRFDHSSRLACSCVSREHSATVSHIKAATPYRHRIYSLLFSVIGL